MLKDTLKKLKDPRSKRKKTFRDIYYEAVDVAKESNLEITMPQTVDTQIHRDNHLLNNVEEYFRRSINIPALENIIQDISSQFSEETLNLYHL